MTADGTRSFAEFGAQLAESAPPITDEQAEAAARILASTEQVAA